MLKRDPKMMHVKKSSICLLLVAIVCSCVVGFSPILLRRTDLVSPSHRQQSSSSLSLSHCNYVVKKRPNVIYTTRLFHRVLSPMDHSHDHSHDHHHDDSEKQLLFFMPKVSRAKVRVAVAAVATFLVASLSRRNVLSRNWQIALNIFVTISITVFLGFVEKSRKWIAELRAQASALWASLEAHSGHPMDAAALATGNEIATNNIRNAQAAERITIIGTVVNIVLTIFKLVAGIVGKSSAMVADAGHSLSDLLSDIVTLWTVRIANLPADDDHPYGHGRFEALGALAIAGMLIMAAVGFGSYAYETFCEMISGSYGHPMTSGKIALVAAAVSILSKELLYRATAVVAQQTESQVLLANAWHHRSDAFSSIVALVSIWGATSGGIPALDPLGGLFVAGMVGITGLRVGWSAFTQLTDTQDFALKQAVEDAVNDAIIEYQLEDDVLGLHAVRTRYLGSSAWVDLEVETNPSRSTSAATQVVRVLKNAILSKIPAVTDVIVVLKTKQDMVVAEMNAGKMNGDDGTLNAIDETKPSLAASPPVTATIATNETAAIINPALTPLQVEANVRNALASSRVFAPELRVRLHGVESVLVHFHDSGCQSDVDIIVSVGENVANTMSVSEARRLAQIAREDVIANATGVVDAKVSLELVRKQQDDSSALISSSDNPIVATHNI